jgi:hypothetical protein
MVLLGTQIVKNKIIMHIEGKTQLLWPRWYQELSFWTQTSCTAMALMVSEL